jgi:ribosomal protein S18 acetylase RimI-like enzyme
MLRRADARDVALIVDFERKVASAKLYGKPLDHAAAASEIDINQYYLHLNNGCIVATGALRQRDDGSIYLSNIAVLPVERRRGFARAMMIHLLALCDNAGERPAPIDLAVHPDNQAARALYTSLGFAAGEIRPNFFGDGEPRLIMHHTRTTRPSQSLTSVS